MSDLKRDTKNNHKLVHLYIVQFLGKCTTLSADLVSEKISLPETQEVKYSQDCIKFTIKHSLKTKTTKSRFKLYIIHYSSEKNIQIKTQISKVKLGLK